MLGYSDEIVDDSFFSSVELLGILSIYLKINRAGGALVVLLSLSLLLSFAFRRERRRWVHLS